MANKSGSSEGLFLRRRLRKFEESFAKDPDRRNTITKGQSKGHESLSQCDFFPPILLSTFGGMSDVHD